MGEKLSFCDMDDAFEKVLLGREFDRLRWPRGLVLVSAGEAKVSWEAKMKRAMSHAPTGAFQSETEISPGIRRARAYT
jgi:hypothetical protein